MAKKSAFTNQLAKKVGIQNWKHFQDAEDMYGACDMPDGMYWTKLVAVKCDYKEDGVPYVMFNFAVTDGEYAGQKPRKGHFLEERGKRTMVMCLEMLAVDLQRLGVSIEDCELDQLESTCLKLSKMKPKVKIQFVNPENPEWGPDVHILAVEAEPWEEDDAENESKGAFKAGAKDEEEPEKEEPEKEDEGEEDDADNGDDEGPSEEQESDEDMDVIPEVGDVATVAPKGRGRPSKCVVVSVDEKAETCTVKRIADKKIFKDVAYTRLDFDDAIPF